MTSPTYIIQYRTVRSLELVYEKKESIIVVQWFQKNPNLRVHHSVGNRSWKLGKPRFPLERWALGLGFFCPHWTHLMDSIYLTYLYQPVGKIKKRTAARLPHIHPLGHCNFRFTSPCRISANSGFSGSLFSCFTNIKCDTEW